MDAGEEGEAGVSGLKYMCPEPGCGNLTAGGRCSLHRRETDVRRGKTAERGYDADWRKLREEKLLADPVCQIQTHCTGELANEVDHRIPIRDWPEGRLIWDNLQSACKPCHSAKTERENRAGSGRILASKQAISRMGGRTEQVLVH